MAKFLWLKFLIHSSNHKLELRDLKKLKKITHSDPYFYPPYQYGMTLSAFEFHQQEYGDYFTFRALKHFPQDYKTLFFAAIYFLYIKKDFPRALLFLKQLQKYPQTPPYLTSIMARITAQQGKLEEAFFVMEQFYHQVKKQGDAFMEKKYREVLYALKAQKDLLCLNKGSKNCAPRDYEGRFYLFKNQKYYAPKPWKPFKIEPQSLSKKLQ